MSRACADQLLRALEQHQEGRQHMTKPTDAETKAVNAEVRAHEVWQFLLTIERARSAIAAIMRNHDIARGDNAARRDCARFFERLTELNLADIIRIELQRPIGVTPGIVPACSAATCQGSCDPTVAASDLDNSEHTVTTSVRPATP